MRFFTFCLPSNIVNIDNSCQYQLLSENNSLPPPSPTAFSISQYFCVLRSPACIVQDELIVINEEEYHCYMVRCLDCGDPLTVRETGKEMSNELAKMEYEEILEFNHKIRKKVKASKRIIVVIFTSNLKHKKPSAAASITLAWTEYKSTT